VALIHNFSYVTGLNEEAEDISYPKFTNSFVTVRLDFILRLVLKFTSFLQGQISLSKPAQNKLHNCKIIYAFVVLETKCDSHTFFKSINVLINGH
jgi:hypothetical protein